MVFLLGHGVSIGFAARIVKRYGKDAIKIVRANPYRLAVEVWGIGFRTADAIAERLGIARDSPDRLDAGLIHVLGEHVEDGHAHVPEGILLERTAELLGVARDLLPPRVDALVERGLTTREILGDRGRCLALAEVTALETSAASAFAELVMTPPRVTVLDVEPGDQPVRGGLGPGARAAAAARGGGGGDRQVRRHHRRPRRRQDHDRQGGRRPRGARTPLDRAGRAHRPRRQAAGRVDPHRGGDACTGCSSTSRSSAASRAPRTTRSRPTSSWSTRCRWSTSRCSARWWWRCRRPRSWCWSVTSISCRRWAPARCWPT
jgi:hypothetical protein